MPKPQMLLPAARTRSARPRKFKRPTADCAVCDNLLRRREGPMERCTHKGRTYRINGLLTMVLCICCARRVLRAGNVRLRLVAKGVR